MLTRLFKLGLIIAAAGALCGGTALAGPIEMFLTSGGQSTSLLIGSAGSPSSVSFTGTLNGWTIRSGTSGISYSPNQVGLNLSGDVVTCAGAGCSTSSLTVLISATGFSVPISLDQFQLGLMGNVSGGTVTSLAYYDTSNNYFCNGDSDDQMADPDEHNGDQGRHEDRDHHEDEDIDHHGDHDHGAGAGTATNQCGSSNLIGSLSLSAPSSGITVNGGPDPIRSYSLTVADTFSFAGAVDPSFSVTSKVTEVPEPGALSLFGAGLLGCALVSRRRRAP